MSWLKIYDWELSAYPQFRDITVGRADARAYFKKFARHFKVSEPSVLLINKRSGGTYYSFSQSIALPQMTNLGTVVHEFAHHLADRTHGSRQKHGKNFKRALKKTYTFAKRYLPQ